LGRETQEALREVVTQLELITHCQVPPRGTQCYELLMAMQRGVRLTVAKALTEYGVYALSQRVGDLKRKYGWPIKSRMVNVGSATVSEYWLE
jgi:hypothetical protein